MDRRQSAELLGNLARVPADLHARAAEGSAVVFSGYGSTTERSYDMGWYTETVARGAFARTLGQQPDVSFKINHDGTPYSRTKSEQCPLFLREDDIGLAFDAHSDADRYPSVREVVNAVEDGLLPQCSFAFRVPNQEWNDDYTERRILEVNLHGGDVSVVVNGANPETPVTVSMRAFMQRLAVFDEDLEAELRADYSPEMLEAAFESLKRVIRPQVDPVLGEDPEYDVYLFKSLSSALKSAAK